MAKYYTHTRTVTQKIPYQFRCEQCHQDSGLLEANFSAESTRNKMTKAPLKEQEKEEMFSEATASLQKKLLLAKQEAEKEEYPEEFKDKCPHCGKPQSWALKGMAHLPTTYAIIGAVLAIIICAGSTWLEYASFTFFSGLIVAAVIGAIGFAIGKIQIGIKKAKTKNVQEKQKPQIIWADS